MNRKIPTLHVGTGTRFDALTIFPVWTDTPRVSGLEWNSEAITVGEREDSAVVGELVVRNHTERMVVALEGDLLRGGKQDRMLARSILLQPHETRIVDALCVEHGRWSGGSDHVNLGGRKSSMSVRNSRDQGEAWRRIRRYENSLGATSSESMIDHLDRSTPIAHRQLDGQRGVVIGIGGRVVGLELFGSPTGLRARWQGILDAAALDARLAQPVRTPGELARRFVRQLGRLPLEDGGDATTVRRLGSEHGTLRVSGIATRDGSRVIHLTAFDNSHFLLENA